MSCAYEYGGLASSLGDLFTTRGRPLAWWAPAFNTGIVFMVEAAFTAGRGTGTVMAWVCLWYDGGTQTSSVSSEIGTTSVAMLLSSTTSDVDSSTYALTQLQTRQRSMCGKVERNGKLNDCSSNVNPSIVYHTGKHTSYTYTQDNLRPEIVSFLFATNTWHSAFAAGAKLGFISDMIIIIIYLFIIIIIREICFSAFFWPLFHSRLAPQNQDSTIRIWI